MRLRVRLRFSKMGKIRFTSHRDVARMWERALRRASLPVAYTEGFSPRPKLSFGLALSTGAESLGEYLDVDLAADRCDVDIDELPARLSPELPVGIDVQRAAALEPGAVSLQEAVNSCTWRIEVGCAAPGRLDELVAAALAADQLVVTRERKGRRVTDDLRPAILSLVASDGTTRGGGELVAELATHPRSLRPSELLVALDPSGSQLEERRVCRTHQWMLVDGAPQEPLWLPEPVSATSAPHAEVRA